jgi:hypothetical protein
MIPVARRLNQECPTRPGFACATTGPGDAVMFDPPVRSRPVRCTVRKWRRHARHGHKTMAALATGVTSQSAPYPGHNGNQCCCSCCQVGFCCGSPRAGSFQGCSTNPRAGSDRPPSSREGEVVEHPFAQPPGVAVGGVGDPGLDALGQRGAVNRAVGEGRLHCAHPPAEA